MPWLVMQFHAHIRVIRHCGPRHGHALCVPWSGVVPEAVRRVFRGDVGGHRATVGETGLGNSQTLLGCDVLQGPGQSSGGGAGVELDAGMSVVADDDGRVMCGETCGSGRTIGVAPGSGDVEAGSS